MWDTTNGFGFNGVSDVTWNDANGDSAVFLGASGTCRTGQRRPASRPFPATDESRGFCVGYATKSQSRLRFRPIHGAKLAFYQRACNPANPPWTNIHPLVCRPDPLVNVSLKSS